MTTKFTAMYQQVGDMWAAWAEELPGANTQGATLEEARENLLEAIAMMLEEDDVPVANVAMSVGSPLHEQLIACY